MLTSHDWFETIVEQDVHLLSHKSYGHKVEMIPRLGVLLIVHNSCCHIGKCDVGGITPMRPVRA